MEKCRVKKCPNFLLTDCFDDERMICRAHKCVKCGKDFRIGEVNITKCLVSDTAACFDAEQEQCQIIEQVTSTM